MYDAFNESPGEFEAGKKYQIEMANGIIYIGLVLDSDYEWVVLEMPPVNKGYMYGGIVAPAYVLHINLAHVATYRREN